MTPTTTTHPAATQSLIDGTVRITTPDGMTHEVLVSELLQLATPAPATPAPSAADEPAAAPAADSAADPATDPAAQQ